MQHHTSTSLVVAAWEQTTKQQLETLYNKGPQGVPLSLKKGIHPIEWGSKHYFGEVSGSSYIVCIWGWLCPTRMPLPLAIGYWGLGRFVFLAPSHTNSNTQGELCVEKHPHHPYHPYYPQHPRHPRHSQHPKHPQLLQHPQHSTFPHPPKHTHTRTTESQEKQATKQPASGEDRTQSFQTRKLGSISLSKNCSPPHPGRGSRPEIFR